MQCHYCELEKEGLPFRCNYCGEYFCSDHRLPENHACPRVGGPKQPGYSKVPTIQERYAKSRGHFVNIPGISSSNSRFRLRYPGLFSKSEKRHITLAAVLVVLVGFSMELGFFYPQLDFGPILISTLGFLIAFFGHELSHKIFAQRNGMWAEFRINTYGLIFTAISAVLPSFKFIAPGHVNVIGQPNKALSGAIALVGPGFNIVFGFATLFLGLVVKIIPGTQTFALALFVVALFNGYMSLFNLIPFMGFDGFPAFEWDKTRWGIALAGAVALTIAGFLGPGYLF
jgi:Zn-dependent protease